MSMTPPTKDYVFTDTNGNYWICCKDVVAALCVEVDRNNPNNVRNIYAYSIHEARNVYTATRGVASKKNTENQHFRNPDHLKILGNVLDFLDLGYKIVVKSR